MGILERILDRGESPTATATAPVQTGFARGEEERFKRLLTTVNIKCKTYEDENGRTIAIRPDEFSRLRKVLSDAGMIPNVWLDAQVAAVEKAGESAEEGWFRFVTRK